jgi:GNAT superfamily N-acetyltransferase
MVKAQTSRTDDLTIRSWAVADCAAIARILAQGWQQAYSGFMSKEDLGPRIDPAHRTVEIRRWLSEEFDPRNEVLLVAEIDGRVVGFAAARLGDEDGLGAASKIPLLYVDRNVQRCGVGQRLLLRVAEWLEEHAPGPVVISAFEQNPFRGLYNAIGGQEAKRIMAKVGATEWPVILYRWPSLQALKEGIKVKQAA